MHQVSTVIKTFSLEALVFRGNDGVNAKAYLMLLTNFLHDALNSGLGIIVGFDYRPAASAFRDGAEKLFSDLKITHDDS